MKVARIQNPVQPQFGTKVFMSPQVVGRVGDNVRNFRKQVKELENNGIDDVLLLHVTADKKLGAETYCNMNGKLLGSYITIEEPFWEYPAKENSRKGKNINIVDVYKKAIKNIYAPDKRYGIKTKNWQGYIPGIDN